MHWLTWLAAGLVAGYAASTFLGMGQYMPLWVSLVAGVAGAILSGVVARFLGWDEGPVGFNWRWLLSSFIGAIVLLFIFREFFTRQRV